MRFTIAAAAALVAGASASYNYTSPPVYSTTEIECTGPTTITWSYGPTTTTVTVTAPTTVTLPCEVTPPAYSAPSAPGYTPAPPAYTTPAGTPPAYTAPPAGTGYPVYPSANGTTYSAPAGTGYPTASAPPPEFTGAASKAGVGLAAVFGLAAYIL